MKRKNMQRHIDVATSVIGLAAAGARWLALSAIFTVKMAAASTLPDYPFLFETGTAKKKVVPDMAFIDITVMAKGTEASSVFIVVNSSAAEIVETLARRKIPRPDIDASGLERSVAPDRFDGKPNVMAMYVVRRHIKVRMRNLLAWPALMTDLGGMKNIESMNSEFGVAGRDAIDLELEERAAHDAQARAQRIANSFGKKLGAVMAVSELPFNSLAQTFDGSANQGYMAPPFIPPSEPDAGLRIPATITLQKSLNVLFKLD